ncbi:hypothetical protein R69746_08810 [Paraburkholderia aspalathi]|nr:hypothetical protein R69746_08810 [Paraburkholderia aspalathi]
MHATRLWIHAALFLCCTTPSTLRADETKTLRLGVEASY